MPKIYLFIFRCNIFEKQENRGKKIMETKHMILPNHLNVLADVKEFIISLIAFSQPIAIFCK